MNASSQFVPKPEGRQSKDLGTHMGHLVSTYHLKDVNGRLMDSAHDCPACVDSIPHSPAGYIIRQSLSPPETDVSILTELKVLALLGSKYVPRITFKCITNRCRPIDWRPS